MNKYLLVLPGGSERRRAWGESYADFFCESFDKMFVIPYSHRGTEEKNLDFTIKLWKIAGTINNDIRSFIGIF